MAVAYHGGKQRIGKTIAEHIYEITEDIEDFTPKGYCEPFCGMLGVYQYIPDLFSDHKRMKYKAGDINKSTVKMWEKAQTGWTPPTKHITKRAFENLKYDGKASAIKGFVGHIYTYRGVFFDGYFPHKQSKIKHSAKKVREIADQLEKVKFSAGSYMQFSNLKGYVIYCDPPYANMNQRYYEGTAYKNRLVFDHEKFWNWCEKMSEENVIFISEYSAPKIKGLEKVWGKKGKKEEKLYVMY